MGPETSWQLTIDIAVASKYERFWTTIIKCKLKQSCFFSYQIVKWWRRWISIWGHANRSSDPESGTLRLCGMGSFSWPFLLVGAVTAGRGTVTAGHSQRFQEHGELFPRVIRFPTSDYCQWSCPQQRKGSYHSLLQFITNSPLLRKLIYPQFSHIWLRKLNLLRPILGTRLIYFLPLEKADDNSGPFKIRSLSPLGTAGGGVFP